MAAFAAGNVWPGAAAVRIVMEQEYDKGRIGRGK